jgi:hypothetical protein
MTPNDRTAVAARVVVILLLALTPARAVIFYSTGDAAYNTTAPAGSLTDSGWQFQGSWGGFLGTPIAPKYFITAKHVGGRIGDRFSLGGVSYATIAMFDDPETDLRIWRICGTFPSFARLYTNNNEVGKRLVAFGRGTRRGALIITTNLLGTIKTNGWRWSLYDGVQRWGENEVNNIINGDGLLGDASIGEVLQATFDSPPNGGPNECHLSTGDSGGAVFIQEELIWKLAGINFAVDGPYDTTDSGGGFEAAVYDKGGLYEKSALGIWTLTPDAPFPQPGSFYSTRISARIDWINSVLDGPAPPDSQPTLQSSATVSGPFTDVAVAAIDDGASTIRVPQPDHPEFYRLRSCQLLRIKSIRLQGGNVILQYE